MVLRRASRPWLSPRVIGVTKFQVLPSLLTIVEKRVPEARDGMKPEPQPRFTDHKIFYRLVSDTRDASRRWLSPRADGIAKLQILPSLSKFF